jgi:hypothetical protein
MMRWAVFIVAGLLLAGGLFRLAPGGADRLDRVFPLGEPVKIDFASLRLHDRPNQYLVCPSDLCTAPADRPSPVIALPVEKLEAKWLASMSRSPRLALVARDAAHRQHDFVQRSRLLRYPDLVTLRFVAIDTERSTFAIYSRSLYGRSDFGVNRARVEGWLAEFAEAQ